MKVQPIPQEPMLRSRPGHAVRNAAWQTAVIAAGLATLFALLLRSLGA
jgi:hypothetical protein